MPPSAQKLAPETWVDVWYHVSTKNEQLEMKWDSRAGGECPFCTACEEWADLSHLLSRRCQERRASLKIDPLLREIMKAEQTRRDLFHRQPPPQPLAEARNPHAGRCPKKGCNCLAPGRSSKTHCCRRCELADDKGVHRLHEDPVTRERWKKMHAPDCTMHDDNRARTHEDNN